MGFLLGGVGEINKNRHPNFMVVDKSKYYPQKFVFKCLYMRTGQNFNIFKQMQFNIFFFQGILCKKLN